MRETDAYMNYPVSTERLMKDLEQICRWERLSGTEEELEAFCYMERELKAAGARTELIFHDAYISLPVSARLQVGDREFMCHTASMAKSTPPEGVKGTLVYVEAGEVLTAEHCRGRIVILGGSAGFDRIHKAWKAGARGVVGCPGEHFHEKIISNAWGSPTPFTRDLIPDVPYVSVLEKTREELMVLVSQGRCQAHMTTVVDTGWRKIPFLTADIEAERPTEQYVMLSGHLDSWYYGATDNGTANCIQLELARIAARHRKEMCRNIRIVVYSGHSHGRYAGSAWHGDNAWLDIHKNCVLNMNCDIIGCSGATDLTRSIVMPEARGVAADFIRAYTGAEFRGGRCGRNGDQSYYIHGVSSAFSSFSKQPRPDNPEDRLAQTRSGAFDFGWWWHTAEDLADKVDPEYFLRDAKIYISIAMYFACSAVLPLDFHETAGELAGLVEYWIGRSWGRYDLTEVLEQARKLEKLTAILYAREPEDIGRFNRLVMALGRILVPVNYTTGNIYENDSGIPLPPMPAFQMIDSLMETPEGSDEAYEIITELNHKRNFVMDSFDRAISLVEDYLEAAGAGVSMGIPDAGNTGVLYGACR